ncbi:aldehyde ferredoxin oxidoreductase family protein [Desulfobacula sp.]|uniref:aldehyde ferredoxin oxidoreductase family protein n=1 Tax=Desulfobacula sp. TaxID=2593537 RepID=UPI0025C15760|nr:aldehyde ferredoxin oxidoreductase family protein [Desulfobacula sp.]MBC2704665.1 aldehyde ferredoxin oxidoreductase family protein [Desulfobacula sp.]
MKGFYKKLLTIDITEQLFEEKTIQETVLQQYLGVKGLGAYLLNKYNPPQVPPLDPGNHLIFCTGPSAGSRVWGSSRYGVFTKSPLTGFFSESYSGGKVPEAIDAAGYDAILIHGQSKDPVVLSIEPGRVVFNTAQNLWGKDTFETEAAIATEYVNKKKKYKKTGIVAIGPAAENGVSFGIIQNDNWHCAGRTGAGTVMASKKIKGILFQGSKKREYHDEDALKSFAKHIADIGRDHPGVKAYKSMGTSQMVKVLNNNKAFPTQYWSKGYFDKWENISADALHTQCDVKPTGCLKCFMACGRQTTILRGRHKGMTLEGPEYETIYAFGGLCLVDSIEEIAFFHVLCDRLGMDTITAGNLCAFAIEAVKRGRVDIDIDYGDVHGIEKLLHMIAKRQGPGDILAQGIKHAARQWDLEDIAVHAKGLEPAGYDPRVLKGVGLAYGVSDRGACHLRGTFYKPELTGMSPLDTLEGKAELLVEFEDRLTIFDTMVLCRFFRDIYTWEELTAMIHALTGLKADKALLQKKAGNIAGEIRKFNVREGLTSTDDRLSKGLFKKLDDTGAQLTHEEYEYMLAQYYKIRGWEL